MTKRALITGINGQDGSYLAEFLMAKGYAVHGITRPDSSGPCPELAAAVAAGAITLHSADITDGEAMRTIIGDLQPDEFYHLAGQTQPGLSFQKPLESLRTNTEATLQILEACRRLSPQTRLFYASSSEIFGTPTSAFQTEDTPHKPLTPYGCSKSCSLQLVGIYRETHKLFVCGGIAYNHESPRRPPQFVTRKITMAAARARAAGSEAPVLRLGNLASQRDWGYAPEFIEAIWASLQQAQATDYILATGQLASVRDFARAAYAALGIDLEFRGHGCDEIAIDTASGRTLISVDPAFFRPSEPQALCGDASRAFELLGWKAQITGAAVAEKMALAEPDEAN